MKTKFLQRVGSLVPACAVPGMFLGCAAAVVLSTTPRASAAEFFSVLSDGIGTGYTLPQSFGDVFTANENMTVTAVGFYDYTHSGLLDSHDVGIFNSSGTLLEDASVPSGTAGTLIGDFRYANLGTPLNLSAGDTYTLAGLVLTDDDNAGYTSPGGVNVDPAISISSDPAVYVFAGGPTVAFPMFSGVSATFYVGPNFEFQAQTSSSTPDNASWAVVLIAAGFLGSARRFLKVAKA